MHFEPGNRIKLLRSEGASAGAPPVFQTQAREVAEIGIWGTMKKIVLATVLAALGSASALAADLGPRAYTKAPMMAAPVSTWQGFYIGGNVGGLWTKSDATWTPLPSAAQFGVNTINGDTGHSSFAGGLQAGYNWQFAPNWVGGIEADWSWTKAKSSFTKTWTDFGTATPEPGASTTMSTSLEWFASARARFGYLMMPNLLAYGTGGVAWGKVDYAANNFNDEDYRTTAAFSGVSAGYVVGGGLECAITGNWLLRGEYPFYRLNTAKSIVATASSKPAFPSGYGWNDTKINQARVALSYKF